MPKFIDMTGLRYGLLTVLHRGGAQGKGQVAWRCVCDCGNEALVRGDQLRSGHTRSCGCIRLEAVRAAVQTHGMSRTRMHIIWLQMKRRCHSPSSKNYAMYGARGIEVCERWRDSFQTFYDDMGEPPSAKHTLDRKDNNGHYSPENCRWATRAEQMRNTRATRFIDIDGDVRTLTEWRRHFNVPTGTFYKRVARGMTPQEALTHRRPL